MKQSFPGYYKDKELSDVLKSKDVIIVLDSSVLCHLYSLHNEEWKAIVEMIGKKADILWLPYNLACDYHRMIVRVLKNKIQVLDSLKHKLQQTRSMLEALPFCVDESKMFETLSKTISERMDQERNLLKQRGNKDSEIRERLAQLYKSKVGCSNNDPDPHSYTVASYSAADEVDAISGAKPSPSQTTTDNQKAKSRNDIIFQTMMQLATDKKNNVLYVYCESSDYWTVSMGGTSYGANPEHQSSFKKTTGFTFYCCSFASFMEELAKDLGEEMSDKMKGCLKNMSYGDLNQDDEFLYG